MAQPSPDWNLVTLKWAGTYLDATPCTGSITLTYNGGVMLDDSDTTPVNIFPSKIVVPLTTMTITIAGQSTQVGYAEVQVPASNDPDIQGAGGTYTLTETLTKGGGRQAASFVADLNAPDGVIWLNKIIPTNPTPGTNLSVVYFSDFQSLSTRVADLESAPAPSGGGITAVTYDNLPAGSTITIAYGASSYPDRPTTRTDIFVRWRGPVPPTSGGTGAVADVDVWENTTP